MNFHIEESLALNKEVVKVVERIKKTIDEDFPEFPDPEENESGVLVWFFKVGKEEYAECFIDLAENTGENLSRVAGFIIVIRDRGQRLLDHYQSRLDVAETAGEGHKASILSGKGKQDQTVATIAKSKRMTATEMKASAASDTTSQIFNSTCAMYKSAIQYLKGRLKSYDALLFAISDEIRRRSRGFKD